MLFFVEKNSEVAGSTIFVQSFQPLRCYIGFCSSSRRRFSPCTGAGAASADLWFLWQATLASTL